MDPKILKTAFLNALLTMAYIVLVSLFISNVSLIFGKNQPDTVFIPIAMLSLLVLSVALVGTLIFGRPILWYIDGRKKDAISLLAITLGVLFDLTIIAFLVHVFVA